MVVVGCVVLSGCAMFGGGSDPNDNVISKEEIQAAAALLWAQVQRADYVHWQNLDQVERRRAIDNLGVYVERVLLERR